MLLALQWFFSRFISFRFSTSFLARPPSPVYIATFSLQVYITRHEIFLSAGAMGLNMPLQASVWPTPSGEIAQPLLQLPSVCIVCILCVLHHLHGPGKALL